MACYTASTDSNRVTLVRPPAGWTTKGAFFFVPFFFFFLCFFFFAPVQGRHLNEPAYTCNPKCDIGETCVPDLSPSVSTLLAYRHAGTVPFFRCQTTLAETNQVGNKDFDDDFILPEEILLSSNGCPYDCQNGGKCISIFGGLSFACICVGPYWGSVCELNGLEDACELDCSSIVESSGDDASQPRKGAFCVESPENDANSVEDQTCVHCKEISHEDEPSCDDLIECKNGGICKIDYQFVSAMDSDPSKGNAATSGRPLKCSSTTSTPIEGTTSIQSVWMDLPPYTLSCDCLPGFQGVTCEEVDVCGTGCQNSGYCISEDTPGDNFSFDDFFDFNTDDLLYDDDFFVDDDDNFNDDYTNFDNDNDLFFPAHSSEVDCTCVEGHCNQTLCGAGASCTGGICIQDNLISPMCSGGKCSQRHTRNPSCKCSSDG